MEQKDIQLSILSPERVLFKGNVTSVTMPGEMGEFTVLLNHASLISSLRKGVIEYTDEKGKQNLNITGGFVDVNKNVVSVCVEQ